MDAGPTYLNFVGVNAYLGQVFYAGDASKHSRISLTRVRWSDVFGAFPKKRTAYLATIEVAARPSGIHHSMERLVAVVP